MQNPLLLNQDLPDFQTINASHFVPAITSLIKDYKALVEEITKNPEPTWDNTIAILHDADCKIGFAWNIISHLNSVQNTDDVRSAYEEALPLITNFSTDIAQHQGLFQLYTKLSKSGSFDFYDRGQKATIDHALRNFRLAGAHLPEDKRNDLKKINQQISELSNKFEKRPRCHSKLDKAY